MAYRRKQTGPAFSTSQRAIVMEAKEAEAQVPKSFIEEFQKWLKQGQSLQGQARAWAQTEAMRQGDDERLSKVVREKQELGDRLLMVEMALAEKDELFNRLKMAFQSWDNGRELSDRAFGNLMEEIIKKWPEA